MLTWDLMLEPVPYMCTYLKTGRNKTNVNKTIYLCKQECNTLFAKGLVILFQFQVLLDGLDLDLSIVIAVFLC